MQAISYARHHFPPEIIRHATWLYLRFTLSYRDVEELVAERGIQASYETVRRWVLKFGPLFARNLRRLRPRASDTWHLDEMVIPSANSGDGCQGGEAGHACLGAWSSVQPMHHP
jgi:transposase-like protein